MEIRVNLTREEVSSFHRQVLHAESEDKNWTFRVSFSEGALEEIENDVKAKLDTREYKNTSKAYPYIEHRIFSKLKIEPSKIGDFDPTGLTILPEVIEAFRGKVCDLMGLAGYTPKQQILSDL